MPEKTVSELTKEYLVLIGNVDYEPGVVCDIDEVTSVYEDIANGMVHDLIVNVVSMIHCNNWSNERFDELVNLISYLQEYNLRE